jgi:hypothetical protein
MIGVIASENEVEIINEFFQLFKTPWEFFQAGKSYDVVISSQNQIPALDAKVVLVYNSNFGPIDSRHGLALAGICNNSFVNFDGAKVPIYGRIATFAGNFNSLLSVVHTSEVAGLEINMDERKIFRLGYDLFQEVAFLLSSGQPKENALIPALDLHVSMLRSWIVKADIPLIEIPPAPPGCDFITCLTHDVDFFRIRDHKFDHTMWGVLYRATMGSLLDFLRQRISCKSLLRNWQAAISLPLVYLGLAKDFWLPFERYLEIEKDLPSTFFLIPFKNRRGDKLNESRYRKRATRYDITDITKWIKILLEHGKEIAVHGIDAWHSIEKGREELRRIADICGDAELGVRIHWLCFDRSSFQTIEKSGFRYDSTFGYNDAIGYRAGTTQVFRPIGVNHLLELPLMIQDTAMFYPREMGLSKPQAWRLCETLLKNSKRTGGVLTVLWHERSLAPERLWGDFYLKLLDELKKSHCWFGTARQVIHWFQKRRNIMFNAVSFSGNKLHLEVGSADGGDTSELALRIYMPQSSQYTASSEKPRYVDVALNGRKKLEISPVEEMA